MPSAQGNVIDRGQVYYSYQLRLAYTQVQAVRENALLWCLHICNDGLSAVPLMIVLIISGIGCS